MRRSLPLILALLATPSALAEPFVVRTAEVTDRKAVIATVEPIHELVARARIGGTIGSLTIKEGDTAEAGAQVERPDVARRAIARGPDHALRSPRSHRPSNSARSDSADRAAER